MSKTCRMLVLIFGAALAAVGVLAESVLVFFVGILMLVIVGFEDIRQFGRVEEELNDKYQELEDAAAKDVQNLLELQRLLVSVLPNCPDADLRARVTALLIDETSQQGAIISPEDVVRRHEQGFGRRAEARRLIEEYVAAHPPVGGSGDGR